MPNNKLKIKLSIKRLHKLFSDFFVPVMGQSLLSLSLSVAEDCITWSTCEGKHGLQRFKELSSFLTRRAMGINNVNPAFKLSRKYSLIASFIDRGGNTEKVYWISVMHCYRMITLPIDYSIGTITGPFTGLVKELKALKPELRKTCFVLRDTLKLRPFRGEFSWVLSGSAGPNGTPACRKFNEDVIATKADGIFKSIGKAFEHLVVVNDSVYRSAYIDLLEYKETPMDKRVSSSRLAFLQDKAGKTRIVGLLDLISQSLLKPVHDHVASILRRLPTDGTFDQDRQRVRVKAWSANNEALSSIDLTACTDRFPAFFQMLVLVMTGILRPDQGVIWLSLIKHRSFTFRKGKDDLEVRYTVGQPMGAYSSWPVMALAHHALVQFAYRKSRGFNKGLKGLFLNYAMLGDDIVIADKGTSDAYKELLVLLGMEYSPSKSFESRGLAEFAKSLFSHGVEMTPFPLALMVSKNNTVVSDCLALLAELARRELKLSDITVLTSLFSVSARKLARLAALSPKSDQRSLPYALRRIEGNDGTFDILLLASKIDYFTSLNTWERSIRKYVPLSHLSQTIDTRGGWCLQHPDPLRMFMRLAWENMENYPLLITHDTLAKECYRVIIGYGWYCYDPLAWPRGLNHLDDDLLQPKPSWEEENDSVIYRSSLVKMDKLIPGYFEPKCVKHTYKVAPWI